MTKIFALLVVLAYSVEFSCCLDLHSFSQEALEAGTSRNDVKYFQIKTEMQSVESTQNMGTIMEKFNDHVMRLEEKGKIGGYMNFKYFQDFTLKTLCVKSFIKNVLGSDPEEEEITAVLEVLDYFNTIYTAKVDFNGHQINSIMDTGSMDVIVNSNLCPTPGCASNDHVIALTPQDGDYSSGFSDYIIALGDEWEITYGAGSIVCRLGLGEVALGNVKVPSQEMCLIAYEEGILEDVNLACLSFVNFNDGGQIRTFMENIVENNENVYPVVTFALSRDFDGYGLMTVGEVSSELYTGELVYHDVFMKPNWIVKLDTIKINGEDVGICEAEGTQCAVVVDTGSSFNSIPTEALVYLMNYFSDNGVSCQEYNSYPSISYVIDGYEYTIEPHEYLTIIGEEFSSMYDPTVVPDEITDCFMNMYTLDIELEGYMLWVLGDIFISKYYTIFDFKTEQVAFAERSW